MLGLRKFHCCNFNQFQLFVQRCRLDIHTYMECEEILKSKFGNNQEVFLQGYCKQANIENCDKTYIDFIPSSLKQFGIEVAMPEIQKKLLAEVT